MIANPIIEHIIESIHIDEHGTIIFPKKSIWYVGRDVNGALREQPANLTLAFLENAVCPALAEIRKIAESSCIVLEECYAHALTK
jgi:hypothetical protein